MAAFKIFGRKKKGRKFTVKFDEYGRSARSRCFEMFAAKIPLEEISKQVDIKIDSVRRYHCQWRKDPGFEGRYNYIKGLFKETPDRGKNIKLFAGLYGITKEQLENILSQPHGLRRLMTGKIYMPAYAAQDHNRSKALELAILVSDHLTKKGGNYKDVYLAIKHYLQKYMEVREQKDLDVEEENKWLEVAHASIAAEIEQEQQGRIKPDKLTEQERNAAIRIGLEARQRKAEKRYWINIGELLAEGYTMQQARDKMVQYLIDNGKPELAERMRKFQDKVHHLPSSDQKLPP